MAEIPPLARQAIEYARRREFDLALATAQQALERHADDMGLQVFVGLLHSRRMELDKAVHHFRAAVALAPRDPTPTLELARALIALDQLDEADRLLMQSGSESHEVRRLQARILMSRGDVRGAANLFEALARSRRQDFESWGNLGACLFALGNARGAANAYERSLEARPDQPQIRGKWAEAEVAAGTGEEALKRVEAAATGQPRDAAWRMAAARLHDLLGRPDQAVTELSHALKLDPGNIAALTSLAQLHERQNRIGELAEDLERLQQAAPDAEKLPLLKALLAYRRRDMKRALELAVGAPPFVDPALRAELIGHSRDRLGDSAGAWNAFLDMNREDSKAITNAPERASRYRDELAKLTSTLTDTWAKRWTLARKPKRPPAFLIGFPRSGTTLVDTFLMGNPGVRVSEENPMLQSVSKAAGPLDQLPELDESVVERLRRHYFDEAAKFVPDIGNGRLVDKFPFGLVATPYIHRLFEGAPIIFAERHPCDVVLSCFLSRFEPTGASAAFIDLVDTARLYDGMMRFWSRCQELLPLNIHRVRYERLVEDASGELGPLARFLDLEWTDSMTDNCGTAEKRGFIKTPSYAQVAEPVYSRSVGRWQRYRTQMGEAIDILAPWADRLGYDL